MTETQLPSGLWLSEEPPATATPPDSKLVGFVGKDGLQYKSRIFAKPPAVVECHHCGKIGEHAPVPLQWKAPDGFYSHRMTCRHVTLYSCPECHALPGVGPKCPTCGGECEFT